MKENPLRSGIRLADGDLLAETLLGEDTDVELVVLSACETGRATDLPGDEAIGLATALLRTGVRSLVVSLWRVEDEATAAIMGRFHELVRAGAALDEALAQAAAEVAKEPRWSHPYYWSGFALVGDPSPVTAEQRPATL